MSFPFWLLFTGNLSAQPGTYKYKINLNEVNEDQLKIELKVPSCVPADEVYFYFPRIVPGTYQIHDYGQIVLDLQAFDTKGNKLYVDRTDETTWRISKAKKLDKLVYTVDDTWDAKLKEPIFESAGTSFDEGKSFLLNAQGLFGFFQDRLSNKVELTVERPRKFYGATSLKRISGDEVTDVFKANSYHDLIDSPIMYCEPDTVNFKLGYGDLQVAVYSPNKKVKAKELKEKILPMLEAQNKYLGNILPVDRYAFLIYLSPNGFPSGNRNALEHNRSSFYCLDEAPADEISKLVIELATHEFLHIVTPLHIKSEEIHHFNYLEPKMSRHLWLYEGVIEYMAFHMQVRTGLMKEQALLDNFSQKLRTSRFYKQGLSLTDLSTYCLIEPYASQYNNIYNKGALTAMCLDITLLKLSEGKYDLQQMLKDLSGYFGQDEPFKDEELFEKIIDITRKKDLLLFFSNYVEGIEVLDFNNCLNTVGVSYQESAMVAEISPMGGIENGLLRTDSLGRMYIHKEDKLDEFGKKYIGFHKGDVLLEWNGNLINKDNVSSVLAAFSKNVKENELLKIKILRKNEAGKIEEKILSTKITRIQVPMKDVFSFDNNPSPEQIKLRKIWLGNPVKID